MLRLLKSFFGLLLLLLLASAGIIAQPPRKFYTHFGGYGHDIGYGVKQTLDGHYIVTGSTSSFGQGNTDVYLAKVDSMGFLRWEKSFGGFNNDIGRQVIQLADSGFVIAGYTNSMGNGGYDVYVVRTDKSGNLVWQKTFGGLDWDYAYDIRQLASSDLVICGSTYSFGYGKLDAYVLKLDLNGNLLKSKTYGGAEDDEFRSFTLTYNNLLAFAGTTKSQGDTKGDCWILKTDLNCDSVKNIRYGDSKKQLLNDIVEATNHDLVVAGATDINGRDSTWAYLLSTDENGGFKYDNNFPRSELYKDYQFMTLTNGNFFDNYIYIHRNYNSPAGFKLEPAFYYNINMWPTKFATYGTLDDDELYDIAKTRDKGYVAVGYTKGDNAILTDVFLVRIDSNVVGATNAVGVNEVKTYADPTYLVYPTVAKDVIYIENPNADRLIVTIKNNLGESIQTLTISDYKTPVHIGHLSQGIYFISLQKADFSKTFKVIKAE